MSLDISFDSCIRNEHHIQKASFCYQLLGAILQFSSRCDICLGPHETQFVALDISKSFDKVWHGCLQKLKVYSVSQ